MKSISRFLSQFFRSYRSLPEKKQYVEFFTAVLTVPVLLTVLILNVASLKKTDQTKSVAESQPKIIMISQAQNDPSQPSKNPDNSLTPTKPLFVTPPECKREIGPINITDPSEGDSVTSNPVSITITQPVQGYCAVVWSYRINNGSWSDYDDKSIALYNPPKGAITFDLRVKSVVTGEQKLQTRKFVYTGSTDTNATPSGSPSN